MAKKQHPRRKTLKKGRLMRKLAAYSVAAGASVASESWIAAAPVYVDVPDVTLAVNEFLAFDIDGDGMLDVSIARAFADSYAAFGMYLYAGGSIAVDESGGVSNGTATVLDSGEAIDDNSNFSNYGLLALAAVFFPSTIDSSGSWFGVENGYLGLRFQIEGQDHFGWARLSVNDVDPGDPSTFSDLTVSVHDFGYESEPNTPILAGVPEPSSLGLLALGAAGVLAMRLLRSRD